MPTTARRACVFLEIAPPPSAASPLDRREGAAERKERDDHRRPYRIDAGQSEAVSRGLAGRERAEQPGRIADRRPGKRNGERVEQEQVRDIVEQGDAAEDRDAIRQPPARFLECREQ